MRVEGIIIQKALYKERDLICQLLLRSGRTLGVYFYGGRGGGKAMKGSILEIGHMIKVELGAQRKKIQTDLQVAKEYKLLWSCDEARLDYRAFYLACFYMEYISKIAIKDDLNELYSAEHEGLFNVLSNALFYLNDSVKEKNFDLNTHLFLFLTKISIQLGIFPDIDHCLYCEIDLKEKQFCLFEVEQGGFSCMDCHSKKGEFLSENKVLREEYQSSLVLRQNLKQATLLHYKQYNNLNNVSAGANNAKFHYINYQFGMTKEQIHSWKMILPMM